jgi:hypothetical protein
MIAKLLIAIPGLLFMIVPMICGAIALSGVVLAVGKLLSHIVFVIKTWFKPQINHVHMTDHEIETRYRELDIKRNGYNPMRHDFHIKELFPRKPEIEKIKDAGKRLFPNQFHRLMPLGKKDEYNAARGLLTNMAVERHHQVSSGQWTDEKQKQWLAMPYLPEVMREVDDEFVTWCFMAVGREEKQHLAS